MSEETTSETVAETPTIEDIMNQAHEDSAETKEESPSLSTDVDESTTTDSDNETTTDDGNEEEEKPKVTRGLAKLAKKEKELATKESELKQLEEQVVSYQQSLETARKDPIKFLQSAGLSLNDLAQYIEEGKIDLNPPETEEAKQLKEQINVANQKQAVADYYAQTLKHLMDNTDKYPLVNEQKRANDVWEVINLHAKDTGQVMSYEQAAQLTEDYLAKQIDEETTSDDTTTEEAKGTKPTKRETKPQKSLSNKMESTISPRTVSAMTDSERVDYAREMLEKGIFNNE